MKSAKENSEVHLRLSKSHDFDFTDQIFTTSSSKRILILKRDPLFTITSWWELIEINRHANILKSKHIDPLKIFYLHEKAVFDEALSIIDLHYAPPSDDFFKAWLDKQTNYIKKFNQKWINTSEKAEFFETLDYENIPKYAFDICNNLKNVGPSNNQIIFQSNFKARTDPFAVKSKMVTDFIKGKKKLIKAAIAKC